MPLTSLRDADPSRIGKYQLLARLGAGGMGVVYLGTARNGNATTNVAIKMLRPELADDADFRARFRREVTVLSRVRGFCTVRVIEADVDSERPYLVTEYVSGPTLAEWVREHGPLGPDMLRGLAAGLAEALAAIHAAGIVHRDLKPGNVLLAADGPKVIDFGIAQTLDTTSVTRTGMSVGSPGFMAPEQVRGKSGPAADIFAWGLTVGFAASGEAPFGTGPADAIFYRVLHDEPNIEGIPEPLKPLVAAALAKAPEDRPTAPELLTAPNVLTAEEAGPRQQAGATDSPSSPGSALQAMLSRTWLVPAQAQPAATFIRRPRRRSWTTRSRVLASALAAVGCLLGGSLLVALTRAHNAGVVAVALPSPVGSCPSFATYCPGFTDVPYSGPSTFAFPETSAPATTYLPATSISVEPIGACEAGCPSVLPSPSVQVSGNAPGDFRPWLEQQGYEPLGNGPQWGNGWWDLNVIVARKFGSTHGGLRAFFFDDGVLIGCDVPDGSTSIQAFRLADNEIDIRYQLHGWSVSFADVRFNLTDSNSLIRLDPLPPTSLRD